MPAFSSITINDRASTPVAHTFVPAGKDPSPTYIETAGGVPMGAKKITQSMRKVGARYRGRLAFTLPVVVTETVNGVADPKVVRTAYISVEATFDEKSSTQERKDAVGFVANALAAAITQVNSVFVDLEEVW